MSSLQVRTLSQMLALEQPKQLYYLDHQLLCYGGSMFIYGKAGTWKSWLAIELMHSLATGKRWLIYNPLGTPLKTLMFQAEQVEAMYQDRLMSYTKSRIASPTSLDPYMRFTTSQDLKLDDFQGIAQLEQAIKEYQPHVAIVDCVYRVVKSSVDTNSIGRFLDELSRLSSQHGVAFICIHHSRKESDEDRGFDEMTGWGGINAWADSILRVTREDSNGIQLTLKWEKTKNARREVPNDVHVQVDQENLRFLTR